MLLLLASLATVQPAVSLPCPNGSTLHEERSGTVQWLICEDARGVREGPMLFVDNGHIGMRSTFRAGLEDGEVTTIRPDGVVVHIARKRAGVLHGLQESFFVDGAPSSAQEMQNGVVEGRLFRWREDGSIVVESVWKNGEPQRFTTYFASGAIQARSEHALPNTTVTEWDESGKIVRTSAIVDGLGVASDDSGPRVDDVHMSCPRETFDSIDGLGVRYARDMCGGRPELDDKTGRVEAVASVPRATHDKLRALGCTWRMLRTAEESERMFVTMWFQQLANGG